MPRSTVAVWCSVQAAEREFGPAASQVRGASLVRQTAHPPPSTRLVQTRLDSASASRSLVEAPRIQAWQLFLGGGESVYVHERLNRTVEE